MSEQTYNGKRIVRNTIALYARMLVMAALGLYTSRVVLNTLGIDDYGVYQVVGGFVGMFSILTSSLSITVSRFITYELGKENSGRLQHVFCTAIIIQWAIAILMTFLMEGIGIWYLNHKMNLPDGRLSAASVVLQCSILSFCVGLVSVPYNAEIIAHERMNIFAYYSIIEAILKLSVVFLLEVWTVDKLKLYAVLILLVSIIMRIGYSLYCKSHFEECRFRFYFDKTLLKEMGGFAGWSFFGEASWILNTQGINLLTNSFFGVSLNAARGIADQVNGVVTRFANNYMTAVDPQITKTYANGEIDNTRKIVCRGAKLSFFLMLFFLLPLTIETPLVLKAWLGIVPDYSVPFTRLSLLSSSFIILSSTLVKAQYATGKIKTYQIVNSLLGFLAFPFTWIAFRNGMGPLWAYIPFASTYFVLLFVRMKLVSRLIALSVTEFMKHVFLRVLVTSLIAGLIPLIIHYCLPESYLRLIIVCCVSVISVMVTVLLVGVEKEERIMFKQFLFK